MVKLNSLESYIAMDNFLFAIYKATLNDTLGSFLGDISLCENNSSMDPGMKPHWEIFFLKKFGDKLEYESNEISKMPLLFLVELSNTVKSTELFEIIDFLSTYVYYDALWKDSVERALNDN